MKISPDRLISISEAKQNFSDVARKVDESGSVVILKNGRPRYLMIDISELSEEKLLDDDDAFTISRRFLAKNKIAYSELAK